MIIHQHPNTHQQTVVGKTTAKFIEALRQFGVEQINNQTFWRTPIRIRGMWVAIILLPGRPKGDRTAGNVIAQEIQA
ncbi:hypothetical protein [Pantoea piersonii]|uniref:hypothetical protein n=1 Tax=Pantoea piersonii TaxID=2364647 RepID=UPI0028AEC78E|nr:hypothetical protein [Pantoea piersonii]